MFNGIYTPIVTPFREDESIDFNKLKHNLDLWGETDLDGIVVLGSNGEFIYLNQDEKLKVVDFVIRNFNRDKKIIVGTYADSTLETIALTKKMAELGAHAALDLPPHYYKGGMNEEIH